MLDKPCDWQTTGIVVCYVGEPETRKRSGRNKDTESKTANERDRIKKGDHGS